MSTIHIFAIGGTGSRVLRSLTMLLSAGVKCDWDIHPIIVDPDHSNEDVSRTSILIKNYVKLRERLSFDQSARNVFFSTRLLLSEDLRMPIENTSDKRFKDYIGLSGMPSTSQALMRALFSDQDLDAEMQVGFEGNPNRGSVVLNQLSETAAFKSFANDFKQGDRVFIISSIFGGTGASGFPLLLKKLRDNKDMPNHALINQSTIGAVTVLPYFKVKPDSGSPIDSATFISKTRSALQYYKRNISDSPSIPLQYLYYIGDRRCRTYDNHKGGQEQRNDAHFVELAAALAVLDFAKQGGNARSHKEFGVKNDVQEITFADLGERSSGQIKLPLIQNMLLHHLFKYHSSEMPNQRYIIEQGEHFMDNDWIREYRDFLNNYHDWLAELAGNDVAFSPFELNPSSATNPLDFVKGHKHKQPLIGKKGFNHFDDAINQQKTDADNSIQRLMDKLYLATLEMAEKDYIG